MKKKLLILFLSSLFLSSCWDQKNQTTSYQPKKVLGYIPLFSNNYELYKVKSEAPRSMRSPGKIYVKDNLIFQSDIGYGVHVIDKSDPAHLKNLGFIRVIGNSEMSIIGNIMYVNASTALVVIDIGNWKNVVELKRIPNAFKQGILANAYLPMVPLPERNVYYDCQAMYNEDRVQIGWIKDSIINKCFY